MPKGKKKKGRALETEPAVAESEPGSAESELAAVQSELGADEAAPKRAETDPVEELVLGDETAAAAEGVVSTESEPQDEWPATVKKGKKSKKDKKKKGALEAEPTVESVFPVKQEYSPVETEPASVGHKSEPVLTEERATIPETTASSQLEAEDEWVESTKGKKGQKNKKKKGGTIEPIIVEPELAPVDVASAEAEPAPVEHESELVVAEKPTVVDETATSQVGPSDEWAEPPKIKKGKKDRKKKGNDREPTVAEPEPEPEPADAPFAEVEPATVKSALVEDQSEPVLGESATERAMPSQADRINKRSEPHKKDKKGKKDKKKKDSTVEIVSEPEPAVSEPPELVFTERALVEESVVEEAATSTSPDPQDEWAESTAKKGKEKPDSAVEETGPDGTVVASNLESKPEPGPIEVPILAETILVTESEFAVAESIPSEEPALAEPDRVEEPVIDEAATSTQPDSQGEWAETTTKQGKKGKKDDKKKRSGSEDIPPGEPSVAHEPEPTVVESIASEEAVSVVPALVEEPASDEAATSAQPDPQDEWAEATTEKGKKARKYKKKKGNIVEGIFDGLLDEPVVLPPVAQTSTATEPALADEVTPDSETAPPAMEAEFVETPREALPEPTVQETSTTESLDPAPAEPGEHSWAEPTGKKKKKKDKKQKQSSPSESAAELEPTLEISAAETTLVEELVRDLSEPPSQQGLTLPETLDTAPTVNQDDWAGASSKKAKKGKKKKGSAVIEEPETPALEPTAPAEDASVVKTEQVPVEEPASKKSKKGKKTQADHAIEVELAESAVQEPLLEANISDTVAEPVLDPTKPVVELTEAIEESITELLLQPDPQPVVESVPELVADLVAVLPATEATVSEPTTESKTPDSSQEKSIEVADSWAEPLNKGKGEKKKMLSKAQEPEETLATHQPSEEPFEAEAVSEVPADVPEATTELPPLSDAQNIAPVQSTPAAVEEPAEVVWAEASAKMGKKDKKKKKRNTQTSEFSIAAEDVPEPSAVLTEEPNQITEDSAQGTVTEDTPKITEDAWADPVSKKSKKGKKKSVSEAAQIPAEPEPIPKPATEVAQPEVAAETTQPEPGEAWPEFSSSSSKKDRKKRKQFIPKVPDLGSEMVAVPTDDQPAEPELPAEPAQDDPIPAPIPNDDIEFTAAVAAGLQHTGFNPDLVIEDPIFRRRSPPRTDGESSPVETTPSEPVQEEPWYEHDSVKQGKKNKKKKKGSKSPSPEESAVEEVEIPGKPLPAESIVPSEPTLSEELVGTVNILTFDASANLKDCGRCNTDRGANRH